MAEVRTEEVPKVTPQMQAFNEKVDALVAAATEKDRVALRELIKPDAVIGVREVTPVMAALIFKEHNGHNREFSYSKALYYAQAMERGDWKINHQGVAFYADGNLADGQHRFAAVLMANKPQRFVVMASFDDDAFDTIDIGKIRNAGDALFLRGVADPAVKAAIVRVVMAYEHKQKTGRFLTPTVIEVEKFVKDESRIGTVIEMARTITKNCSDPCMSENETAAAALLLLRGGYTENAVSGYLSAIQLGVADHEGAVVIDLGRQFMKARISERRVHRMNKEHKLALLCKGAQLHVLDKTVRSLKWDPKKEPMPAPTPPVVSEAAE